MTTTLASRRTTPRLEPLNGFGTFGLGPELLRAVRELGFVQPTAIQNDAIPPMLAGRDLLACASTGSGKTAAFLLPILERLRQRPRGGTRALIITPTRELAVQIVEHHAQLAKHTRLRAAAVYGGVGMRPQEEAFRRGVDVLVATPGRLLDHMRRDYARLAALEVLVLDEADRMLDMGFLPDIRRVLSVLPRTARQTLFFSATMPAPIVALSRELLHGAAHINIARKPLPATGITQAFYPIAAKLKADLLIGLLQKGEVGNVIVFCRTKHRADRVAEKIGRSGITTARIHGNRSQSQRTEALAGFKSGRYRVLVATDIVARGIDVTALDHVVNFDVPNSPDDYIHRVGRTARAEATGDAYTLVSPEEETGARAIEQAVGRKIDRRFLTGFDYRAQSNEQLEVPLGTRVAAIRQRKAEERARARAKSANSQNQPKSQPESTQWSPARRKRTAAGAQQHDTSRPRSRGRGRLGPRRGAGR
ncbi:MAG TPA: DEAD/DEAH box helicase [Longimicrobiales bacterium]|nr:DEAD/DEAH box helicase [Longimicrobiales bacterium]